jgi:hypothetical protein
MSRSAPAHDSPDAQIDPQISDDLRQLGEAIDHLAISGAGPSGAAAKVSGHEH